MPRKTKWTQKNLELAIAASQDPGVSRRDICRWYGIPRTTLYDKLSERRQLTRNPSTGISKNEEDEIATWLRTMSQNGFQCTRADLLFTVKSYLDFKGRTTRWRENQPGDMWYSFFRKRNPDIVFSRPQKLSKARVFLTEPMIRNWHDRLRETICASDPEIFLDPSRIYNADELGFALDSSSGKVCGCLGDEYIYQVSQEMGTTMTVLVCTNAAGHFIHPLLVYPPTQFNSFALEDVYVNCFISESPKGWINADLFALWLQRIFIPQTSKAKKPILLLVDGHASHHSLRASELCAANGILLYTLLDHALHIIQPLVVGVFAILKAHWRDAVQHRTGTDVVSRRLFGTTFKQAYEKTVENKTAVSDAFRNCGIFPLNYDAIDKSKLLCIPRPLATLSATAVKLEPSSPSSPAALPTQMPSPTPESVLPSSVPSALTTLPLPTSPPDLPLATSESTSSLVSSSSSTPPLLTPTTTLLPATPSSTSLRDHLHNLCKLSAGCGDKLNMYLGRVEEGYDMQGADQQYDEWKCIHDKVLVLTQEGSSTHHPPEIPTTPRGQKFHKTVTVPELTGGQELILKIVTTKQGLEAEREDSESEKKVPRKCEFKEKKQKSMQEKEKKQSQRSSEERKKEMERKKKEKKLMKSRLQEKDKKEVALQEKRRKCAQ